MGCESAGTDPPRKRLLRRDIGAGPLADRRSRDGSTGRTAVRGLREPPRTAVRNTDNRAMRVAFLGLGLIGGSIARALRARDRGAWSVTAWTPNGDGPRAAAADGTIDAVAADPAAAVQNADLIVLAAAPLDVLTLLDRLAEMRSQLP